MLASLLYLAVTLELTPTDDVWVYAHASDQVNDPFLRVWGSGGVAIASAGEEATASWSMLSFDLPATPAGSKLTAAKLVLHHVPGATYTYEESVLAPLEVRAVKGGFKEKDWSIADSDDFKPDSGDEAFYASTAVKPAADDKPIEVEVDLLKGKKDFRADLERAFKGDHKFGLALASRLEIGTTRKTYKFYSRAAEEKNRPKLVLVWD